MPKDTFKSLQEIEAEEFERQNLVEGMELTSQDLDHCDDLLDAALQTQEMMHEAHPIKVLFFVADDSLIATLAGVVLSMMAFLIETLAFSSEPAS